MYEVMKLTGHIVEKIDGEIRHIEETLGAKSAKSYDEYSERCGVITGLLTARRFIVDLTEKLESHDD